MNPIRKQITSSFEKSLSQKDFYERYVGIYFAAQVIGLICLTYSAIVSYKYYQSIIATFDIQTYNNIIAGILTSLQSVFIALVTKRVINDFFSGSVDVMTKGMALILIALIGWNFYTDNSGAPKLAESMTAKPIDLKTPETDKLYENQLQALRESKESLEGKLQYMKGGGCRKDDCMVPGGKAYYKGRKTSFYHKEVRRLNEAIIQVGENIQNTTNTWQRDRGSNLTEFEGQMASHANELQAKTTGMRFLVVGFLVLYVLCSIFRTYFGIQVAGSGSQQRPQPQKAPPSPASKLPSGYDQNLIERLKKLEEEMGLSERNGVGKH